MENLFFTLPYFIANLLHTSREASPLGSTGRDKIYMYLITFSFRLFLGFTYIIMSIVLSCIPTSDSLSISPSLKSVFGLEYPNW